MAIERAEKIYSTYSGVYDLLFDAALQPGRRRAVAALGIEPGDEVLEVGVGTGLSLPLYPDTCHVTGIDISLPLLRRAAARAAGLGRVDVTLRRMSAERLAWPDAAFDRILLSYVISAVEKPDQVIREVWRVCRPGGRVIFLNHFASRARPVAAIERRLTPLTRRLGWVLDFPAERVTDGGRFEIERVERVNLGGYWSMVVCRRPVQARAAR